MTRPPAGSIQWCLLITKASTRDPKSTEKPEVTAGHSGRVRLDRDQRRLTLLDAAAAAFAEGGFQATSMEEIASRAGVTRLIVYRHFDSKEDLYRAVLDRAVTSLTVAVRGEIQAGPTVRGVVKGFLDAGRAYPDGFRLLVRQSAREPDFADYA